VLAAFADAARRISAAISRQQRHPLEALIAEASGAGVVPNGNACPGVNSAITLASSADVQVDHHMLAAAIQMQVGGTARVRG